MQIHQMSQFVLGMVVAGGGLFILFISLHECWKSKTLPPKARQPLVSATIFIALGATHLSRSFNWPHQDSYWTNLIEWASLPVVLVGVVLLNLLKRTDKKAEANVGTTVAGEHTA